MTETKKIRRSTRSAKRARTLTQAEYETLLEMTATMRHPLRSRLMVLLSFKSALRSIEMTNLTWDMVLNGNEIDTHITLPNWAAKGAAGGGRVRMPEEMRQLLRQLVRARSIRGEHVICSERGGGMSRGSVAKWFERVYRALDLKGCSSHSGRRTAITGLHRKGADIVYCQAFARHAHIATTRPYVEVDEEKLDKYIMSL